MKKSFKIISALILSSTMAFGLSATIFATSSKNIEEVHADVGSYYSSITDSMSGTTLLNALNSLNNSKRTRTVGYDGMKTFSAVCDADPDGSGKIIGFYDNAKLGPSWDSAATWNREHVWPNARGGNTVEGDAHMVRPASVKTNSGRGSKGFGVDSFDPGNSVAYYRGVASRIIFYCAIANKNLKIEDIVLNSDGSSPSNTMGTLSDMLRWNLQYLPTDTSFTGTNDLARRTELSRNEKIQTASNGQGNRNPFIDHPEYACKIWGDTNATTRQICGSSVTPADGVSISKTEETIAKGGTTTISATSTDSSTITWTTSNSSVVTVSSGSSASGANVTLTGVAAGNATITAKATINSVQYSGTCAVTVTASGGSGGSGYNLVTSISTLFVGDVLLIGNKNAGVVAGALSGSILSSVSATYSNNTITNKGNGVEFTLGGSSGAWTLTSTEGQLYCNAAKKVNYSSNGSGTWNISIASSGTATVTSGTSSYGSMQYNSGSPRFTTYTSSVGTIELYKKSGTTTKTLSSIAVKTAPTKTTYTAGEYFAPAGLVITATYSDNSKEDISYASNSSSFSFNPNTTTALTVSNTSVTITYGGKSCSQTITVNASTTPAVNSVTVSPNTLSLNLNGTKTSTLTATVSVYGGAAQTVNWSSSNTSVATVDNTGKVTAVAAGTATITATSTVDTSKKGTCTVTVLDSSSQQTSSEIIDLTAQGFANQADVSTVNGTSCTATFAKEDGSNGPKYYTSGSAVRAYPGNTITIASSSLTIIKIEFTFGSSDGSNEITSSPATYSNGTWTGSASSVTFTIGGTSGNRRFSQIKITYQGGTSTKTLSSIAVSDQKTTYAIGDTFVKPTVTATYSDSSTANVSGYATFTGYDLNTAGNQTVNVSYTEGSVTKETSYTITVVESTIGTSPYENGVAYKMYLVNTSSTKAGTYYFTGSMVNTYYGATSTTKSEGVDVYFEAATGGQNIYYMNNNVKYYFYVAVSGTYYNFKCDTTTAPTTKWVYSATDECIAFPINSVNYTFGNYGTNTTFSAYSLASYPNNYKVQFETTLETNPALEYAQNFLSAFTCDATGTNAPTFASGKSWASLKTAFQALTTPHQNTLKNATANESGTDIEKAVARYDYVVAKYGYENFMDRTITNSANKMNVFNGNSTNNILLILGSVSLLGGLTYLAYFLKKRKED